MDIFVAPILAARAAKRTPCEHLAQRCIRAVFYAARSGVKQAAADEACCRAVQASWVVLCVHSGMSLRRRPRSYSRRWRASTGAWYCCVDVRAVALLVMM